MKYIPKVCKFDASLGWVTSRILNFPLKEVLPVVLLNRNPLHPSFTYKSCHQLIYICTTEIDNCYPMCVLFSLLHGIKFDVRYALWTYDLLYIIHKMHKVKGLHFPNLIFRWFIPVVCNHKYRKWYKVYKSNTTKFIMVKSSKWQHVLAFFLGYHVWPDDSLIRKEKKGWNMSSFTWLFTP
jgi:hypothetical protein